MKLFDVGGKVNQIIQSGYEEWIIDTEDPLTVDLVCDGHSSIFLNIKQAKELQFDVTTLENASLTLLIWNNAEESITFEETYHVKRNGELNLAYGECNQADIHRNSNVLLEEEGAKATIKSATLCKNNKKMTMSCTSKAPYTEGRIENYSVVVENADYVLNATGKIVKGAHGSKSHQVSRALTFNDHQNTTIIPKLLIDENDVEASHATSVGQIDQQQMVYLQSRGLNEQQVMRLITIGYLMPITTFIQNEELREVLTKEIESKVSESCLM